MARRTRAAATLDLNLDLTQGTQAAIAAADVVVPPITGPSIVVGVDHASGKDFSALQPTSAMTAFERLLINPNVNVDKLERMMAMYERADAKRAELEWNSAMALAQEEMRPVARDAANPSTRSRYASYKALDDAIRPIYTKHKFAVSFNTGEVRPDVQEVKVLCYINHVAGHRETFKVDLPADGKGAKGGDVMTLTHAAASAITYGKRYLLQMAFNIAIGENDDDGNRAGNKTPPPAAPEGFDQWLMALEAVAENGWPALQEAWGQSDEKFRNHLNAIDSRKSAALKKRAQDITKANRA